MCEFIGLPELAEDERFRTNPKRNANRAALEVLLQRELEKQPAHYWLEQLPKQGVPASAINNIAEALDMPQIKARGMRIELDHPLSGKISGIANPLNFSQSKVEYRNAAPLHGGDTRTVLESVLGLDQQEIERLVQQGAVSTS